MDFFYKNAVMSILILHAIPSVLTYKYVYLLKIFSEVNPLAVFASKYIGPIGWIAMTNFLFVLSAILVKDMEAKKKIKYMLVAFFLIMSLFLVSLDAVHDMAQVFYIRHNNLVS